MQFHLYVTQALLALARFLLLQLLLVELKFLSFQNVTIRTSTLSRAAANSGHYTTSGEHLLYQQQVHFKTEDANSCVKYEAYLVELWIQFDLASTGFYFLLGFRVHAGDVLLGRGGLSFLGNVYVVMVFVPLSERLRVYQYKGVFDKGLGSDKLVV